MMSYDDWRAARLAGLQADAGWLNITDRVEYGQGTFRIGRAADNDLVLSVGPDHLGTVTRTGSAISFANADGQALPLDHNRVTISDLLLEFTALEGHYAIRVRDLSDQARFAFDGLSYFPADPAWRIRADWVALDAPIQQPIDTVAEIATSVTVTHKAVFHHGGQQVELLATHGSADRPMFVLRDLTARDSTYPAARFVFGEDVTADSVTLDFNKAVTPPCGFTPFATCPLPPPQNILPFRIEAGEKRPRL
ncbi:DUF1684 domain-containing protein [Ketogulonicigenium vulgare]|uniref:Lipoprotein, putative n=2 Tax=Ketogulonicigenium vulgare TaxID=92945 RepID=F9Y5Y9_KETVW|nr:DUF1684 domain-containing protein [Ketogulonicigenium vulgare]ADO42623.1 conserved hypothetical protein [Ketogulonicigenium vulgare Y25]AEM40814.1 Lipoprotein, putative [Ketogulonicigenium vulgare WSH-001]ALJ80979.1 hypothetical protein KVH_07175 [Ketogulonicigenium vulgare]ANW33744.1 hypothetical protein KvSKV_07145 [Ketogulonicigenium vulgare]AOZ54532.1 hypothetical protein KVC_1518 [Ketogulonicigenium vulgare]